LNALCGGLPSLQIFWRLRPLSPFFILPQVFPSSQHVSFHFSWPGEVRPVIPSTLLQVSFPPCPTLQWDLITLSLPFKDMDKFFRCLLLSVSFFSVFTPPFRQAFSLQWDLGFFLPGTPVFSFPLGPPSCFGSLPPPAGTVRIPTCNVIYFRFSSGCKTVGTFWLLFHELDPVLLRSRPDTTSCLLHQSPSIVLNPFYFTPFLCESSFFVSSSEYPRS